MNRLILCLLGLLWQTALAQPVAIYPLKVAPNNRYFVGQNNQPFLYQADTGWQLFARLSTVGPVVRPAHRGFWQSRIIGRQIGPETLRVAPAG